MKNFLVVVMVLIFSAVLFPSCKKAYKCSCQDGTIENPYLKKLSKSQADEEKAKCEASAGCQFLRDK